ncbi:MAG: DnaB-like helicase C-terminal domain-containing protein [archaeon]
MVIMSAGNQRQFKIEKKFLAYLFKDKKYIAESLSKINKSHMTNAHYLYMLIISYYHNFKDIITDEMVDLMFEKKNLDTDTIVKYKSLISEIRSITINNDAEFEAIMEELLECKKRREYLGIAENIINMNPIDCSTDILEKMENNVKDTIVKLDADETGVRKEGAIKDSIEDRKAVYEFRKNNPEAVKTIPTGFKKIDDTEGGFRPGELIYVIGRKGDGKSVLMLNLGHNMWVKGHNVILFSLEISKEDYERRFDARAAGISSNGLKRGQLSEAEEKIYNDYLANQTKGLTPKGDKAGIFYVVDVPAGCTPAFIDSKIETIEQVMDIKFDVAITDYAGIMEPNVQVEQLRHAQGKIALELKRIARSRDMTVISAAQMNRSGREDKKADTAHVAESDQISDHIDWGIAIRSLSDSTGKIESFKTRDAAPFEFHFTKKYSCMQIIELEDDLQAWDSIGNGSL